MSPALQSFFNHLVTYSRSIDHSFMSATLYCIKWPYHVFIQFLSDNHLDCFPNGLY